MKDRASSGPKMTCRNWECGVIVPAGSGHGPKHQGDSRADGTGTRGTVDAVFGGCVPLPMVLPGTEYSSGDVTRLPWFIDQR